MKECNEEHLDELIQVAIEAGASAAKLMPASKIVVDERVRLKCEIPLCFGYNQYLTCPPHVMEVESFSRILSRFECCLLVQVEAQGMDSSDKVTGRIDRSKLRDIGELHTPYKLKLLKIVETVEAAAFKKGMRFATGLVGGTCALCESCVDDKISDACRHPLRARPAMEGVGIDVFKTAQNAGLSIHLSSSNNVQWTGLVLLC